MLNFIFSVLLVASFVLVIVTVALAISGAKKNATFQECNGRIIDFYENSSRAYLDEYESVSISPVVEYTVHGTRYEFVGGYYSTDMKIGDDIIVLYDPFDPADATIKSGTIFAPIITGMIAAIFLILATVYFVIKSKGLINKLNSEKGWN